MARRRAVDDDANDLANIKIIKGCILFNEVTGHFFRANASAVFVFERLKEGTSLPALVEAYRRQFGVSQHVAERDLQHFLDDLQVVR
jgi:hypothetical protein